jgi:UDP-N-acetylmuramyl pentapeptide phosphotransferase/UDP-N-acetylglucosamine-1-phosphate transferase
MNLTLAFIVLFSSFAIVFLLIPELVFLANKKKLNFTAKEESNGFRKRKISSLGGVAIFISIRVTQLLFFDIPNFPDNFFIASLFILFITGLNDDLAGSHPISRLVIQLVAALIIIYPEQFYLLTLNGFLGIDTLNPIISIFLTCLFIIGTINAYNLIDGIDGLAGSLGIVGSFFFTFLFYLQGDVGLMFFSICLTGSLIGFLCFNISPAKIFLGDSGSYVIGFSFSILSIKLINEVSLSSFQIGAFKITSALSIISAIIIIPVYDTLRVFTLRLLQKKSPFKGDYNHLHHILLRIGFSHRQVMLIFSFLTIVFFCLSVLMQSLGPTLTIIIFFVLMMGFNWIILFFQKELKTTIINPPYVEY